MQIVYTGPFDEVEVPDLDLIVSKGMPILVDDAVGKNMIKQDIWTESKSAGKPRKTGEESS